MAQWKNIMLLGWRCCPGLKKKRDGFTIFFVFFGKGPRFGKSPLFHFALYVGREMDKMTKKKDVQSEKLEEEREGAKEKTRRRRKAGKRHTGSPLFFSCFF